MTELLWYVLTNSLVPFIPLDRSHRTFKPSVSDAGMLDCDIFIQHLAEEGRTLHAPSRSGKIGSTLTKQHSSYDTTTVRARDKQAKQRQSWDTAQEPDTTLHTVFTRCVCSVLFSAARQLQLTWAQALWGVCLHLAWFAEVCWGLQTRESVSALHARASRRYCSIVKHVVSILQMRNVLGWPRLGWLKILQLLYNNLTLIDIAYFSMYF